MQHSAIQQQIAPIIEPSLNAMGYRLVRISWQGNDRRRVLQIMLDRLDGEEISVEHCEEASHTISALLDVKDPIESAYELEVSSPGIDRPLASLEDFENYQGFEVKVEMAIAQDGRRRYRGDITQIENGVITLVKGGEQFEVDFEGMASAKLVLSDGLIKEMQRRLKSK